MSREALHISHGLFALRHGRSSSNDAEVIASQRDNGERSRVVAQGVDQVARAAEGASFNGFPVVVLSSPFRRCRETAEQFVHHAGLVVPGGVQIRPELGERDFGAFEGGPDRGYDMVYEADELGGPDHREGRAESTRHVAERMGNLFAEVVDLAQNTPVVLVTHADPGEILQATLLGLPPTGHRLRNIVPKLQNGELRRLV